ncbi:MAG TPA: type II toxin-antitoxin system VapB family antitoxin [Cyclobacteriaceae bacterium]|nr:type II toxin-antitoxin system VapB family antitoxin [Cyclobacteriaceae bacterium]
MRTNIEIDDKLMEAAMKALNARTKKETVEHGLKMIVRRAARDNVRKLRGKVEMYADAEGRTVQVVFDADRPKYRKKRS